MAGESRNLSGMLLEWPHRTIQRGDLLASPSIIFDEIIQGSSWERYTFESSIPLHGEDGSALPPPFRYPLVCRRSGSRLLALSLTRAIVEYLVQEIWPPVLSARFRPVSIGIDQLVKNLASKPTQYALSFAHARVPAFGTSLRAVSYYGDDLAEAAMFRDQLSLLVFFTCGLREARGGGEIIRLGGDGHISFVFSGARKVIEVEKALSFLRKEGYLANDVWLAE